jgi:hypothetical protein
MKYLSESVETFSGNSGKSYDVNSTIGVAELEEQNRKFLEILPYGITSEEFVNFQRKDKTMRHTDTDTIYTESLAREIFVKVCNPEDQEKVLIQLADNCFDAARAFMKAAEKNGGTIHKTEPAKPATLGQLFEKAGVTNEPPTEKVTAITPEVLGQILKQDSPVPEGVKTELDIDLAIDISHITPADILHSHNIAPYLMVAARQEGEHQEKCAAASVKAALKPQNMWIDSL